ncbi:hypothetical protein [Mariprofundus ferrooxydans]|uniref:hypothetical protein n=1 Tax=Mariprofundus ferrooxydans TaxID=314344 RepID=UPI001430A362|nr:hypothetical protein [Mariprofundus ferrooxydans]
MFQPFFDFVEKFATDFSWKRLVILVSLVILAGTVFFLYEAQTATYQLSKYERAVTVLEKLESLSPNSDEEKEVINNIYTGLTGITESSSNPATFSAHIPIELKQALLGASPWLLFCLFFVPGYFKGNEEAPSIVGGTLALAFIMGLGGYFIPVEWSSWIAFGLYPFGVNLLILILLIWFGNKE